MWQNLLDRHDDRVQVLGHFPTEKVVRSHPCDEGRLSKWRWYRLNNNISIIYHTGVPQRWIFTHKVNNVSEFQHSRPLPSAHPPPWKYKIPLFSCFPPLGWKTLADTPPSEESVTCTAEQERASITSTQDTTRFNRWTLWHTPRAWATSLCKYKQTRRLLFHA